MKTASRSPLIPVSALILVPICCTFPPTHVLAAEHPVFLLAAEAPAERPSQPPTWADDLEHRLSTYFKKKYPSFDFTPYTEELTRVRGAVSRGDRWAIKREMGVFLKMLASRAHGLEDDAAEELIDLAQQTMPVEEFAIIYPRIDG
ncbi:MAG TPA: hypothetical protein VJM82_05065 [Nitrospiraceae bacterium]|nr:hypothetical protein [Nitrospiraceae bacterium]